MCLSCRGRTARSLGAGVFRQIHPIEADDMKGGGGHFFMPAPSLACCGETAGAVMQRWARRLATSWPWARST